MKTGFKVSTQATGAQSDFGDLFIQKALFTQGGLWLWGQAANGALGDNQNATDRSSPVQTTSGGAIWKLAAGGVYHTACIKTDGTLWTWGSGTQGQLGDNTTTGKSSPVQTLTSGYNWKLAAGGQYHTAAIKTDGTLWTWGNPTYGQLGDNQNSTTQSSPVQTVSGGTNWKQIACGATFTSAVKTDGTLWTWGRNGNGQLGDNSIVQKSSPVQTVAGGTNWKQTAAGRVHIVGIKTDGTLWLWGNNTYGILGDNTNTNKSSPVQTVAGGTNWKLVACGRYHTMSVKTDGTLWTWGAGAALGTLGNNNTVNTSSPVQTVSGGTNWKQISCGGNHGIGIREDYY